MFPMGISIACSSRVGMYLGMDEPKEAHISSTVGIILAAIVSGTGGLILFCTPHTLFPSLFSPDEKLVNLASELIPMLAFYVFADGVQAALSGIVKGCGRQSLGKSVSCVFFLLRHWFQFIFITQPKLTYHKQQSHAHRRSRILDRWFTARMLQFFL